MPTQRPQIIAHHLIWTLYGHWLANDLRGSGSQALRVERLADLGPIHQGRKPHEQQPSRKQLREFHQHAEPLLNHKKLWINSAERKLISEVFAETISSQDYTVWACAILSNHVHLIVRKHRDDALTMWHRFADCTRLRLREDASVADNHPVWSTRPYKVFLTIPDAVRACIHYVEQNPEKEGLAPQSFVFVTPYDNWPFHKSL